ncbi:MAG: YitT family protein [Lachnospiraceae bacterium]|nr:YitT family protein [Lachnospiraceae bacterium]
MNQPRRNKVWQIIAVVAASLLMAANIKSFVRTGGLYPGGVTGAALLIQRAILMVTGTELPYTLINLLLNAVPVYIGLKFLGRRFTLYSIGVIVLTSIFTDLMPAYMITQDVLLISIFGGIINGCVVSICLLSGFTSGGTDFIAIFLSDKKGIDSFNVVLGFNVGILVIAALMFGWDKALYSIIFQFVSTQVIHFFYRKYQRGTLFVVTTKPREVCEAIYREANHGATILEGEGSYGHCERNVVYSVVAEPEIRQIVKAIKTVDPEAFTNVIKTQQVEGRFYQRPED